MGLTQEILDWLAEPFEVGDHEFRSGGFGEQLVYITEEPLAERLTSVDPNWQFRITSTVITDYNLSRPDSATVTAELTICGVTRSGVGSLVAKTVKGEKDSNGKWIKYETPIILSLTDTEIKGAATDALKRCARLFGIGSYLLRLKGVKIRNEGDFARWYRQEFGGSVTEPEPANGDDDLDDVFWTRDPKRVNKARDYAAMTWQDEDGRHMPLRHVYNRMAIIIGSEARPKNNQEFLDMMEQECVLSPDVLSARIEDYVPQSEQDGGE